MKYSKIYIKPSFCFGISLLLLLIPVKWVLCWMLAAIVHEFGHYLSLRLLHVDVSGITIGLNGAVMDTSPMSEREEAICASAGPLFGLSLIFWVDRYPTVAICALLQSLFNILPIYPLDGGRVLLVVLRSLLGHKIGDRIHAVVGYGVVTMLNILAGYLWLVIGIGPIPLICTFIIGMRCVGKMTCKDGE